MHLHLLTRSPSTGLLAIALALGVCGRVSLYGFSLPAAPSDVPGAAMKCERHYWECPKWAEERSYHDPQHTFHMWSREVALREAWRKAGIVDDGPTTFGPGEAGAAAVRAADPRNVSAPRRRRWVALRRSQEEQERPGSSPRWRRRTAISERQ